jgi:hypothetical protein
MEPAVIAALITAAANIGKSIFEKWSGFKTPIDKQTDDYMERHYDSFRALLSDHCVLLLKRMEDGQNHDTGELMNVVYPNPISDELKFSREFEYRLRFMEVIGLITQPTSEYYITPVGVSFLRRAREKRDYFRVLFS